MNESSPPCEQRRIAFNDDGVLVLVSVLVLLPSILVSLLSV